MTNDPIETAELVAFARAVEAKSLTRAAAELRTPRATLGRRLARLEERLGTRLLRRTTRSLALTDAGTAFYTQARIVLDAVAQAESSVRRLDGAELRGDLRLSTPPLMGEGFHAFVADFAAQHPLVRLQVHVSTEMVDIQRGACDVAIRASSELQPGLVARVLARSSVIAVAAPAYLAAQGRPRSKADLRQHRCLMGFSRGEVPQTYWPTVSGGKIHVEGVFFSNELHLLAAAARAGLGIALLPQLLVADDLERGTLEHVLERVVGAEARFAIVHSEREFVPPQVRAFVDAAARWAATEPSLRGAAGAGARPQRGAGAPSALRRTSAMAARASAAPGPSGKRAR